MSAATFAAAGAGGVKEKLAAAPAVVPATLLGLGLYLAWFGVHYWRTDVAWPSDPVKAVLTGRPIPAAARSGTNLADVLSNPATATPVAGQVGGAFQATAHAVLAQIAQKYVGTAYHWGGKADTPGNWDCSSFVSYCLHEGGFPLPGGRWGDPGYPPNAHGPTTGTYLLYGTPINRGQVGAGDLVVWPTHMGIAVSADRIVAARSTSEGTGYSDINATSASLGEVAQYRRPPDSAGAPPATKTRVRPV